MANKNPKLHSDIKIGQKSLFKIYENKKILRSSFKGKYHGSFNKTLEIFPRLKPTKYNSYVSKVMPDFIYKFTYIYTAVHTK